MKKIKFYLFFALSLLASFGLISCDKEEVENKDETKETPPEVDPNANKNENLNEISYTEFKDAYNNKETINYTHLDRSNFYGYMDNFDSRESDGTPILEKVSLDLVNGKWIDELGLEGYSMNASNSFYVLTDSYVEAFKNPPATITSLSFYKDGDNFIIVSKGKESSHIYGNNKTEYTATITMTYNKYFYLTDYLKKSDELLSIRIHDNLILWEEHIKWGLNKLDGGIYELNQILDHSNVPSKYDERLNSIVGSKITFYNDGTYEWVVGNSKAYGIYYENTNELNQFKYKQNGAIINDTDTKMPEALRIELLIDISPNGIRLQSWVGQGDSEGFSEFYYVYFIGTKIEE